MKRMNIKFLLLFFRVFIILVQILGNIVFIFWFDLLFFVFFDFLHFLVKLNFYKFKLLIIFYFFFKKITFKKINFYLKLLITFSITLYKNIIINFHRCIFSKKYNNKLPIIIIANLYYKFKIFDNFHNKHLQYQFLYLL